MSKPYAKGYNDCINQAQDDQRRNARPELTHYLDSIDKYDVIYLGYPDYWGTMPMAVFSFLEHYDFKDKALIPFCTHEGSGFGHSVSDIKKLCPTATIKPGLAIHGSQVSYANEEIKNFVKGNK
jgi:flavodoxin